MQLAAYYPRSSAGSIPKSDLLAHAGHKFTSVWWMLIRLDVSGD
jgi:hypothetical protein